MQCRPRWMTCRRVCCCPSYVDVAHPTTTDRTTLPSRTRCHRRQPVSDPSVRRASSRRPEPWTLPGADRWTDHGERKPTLNHEYHPRDDDDPCHHSLPCDRPTWRPCTHCWQYIPPTTTQLHACCMLGIL